MHIADEVHREIFLLKTTPDWFGGHRGERNKHKLPVRASDSLHHCQKQEAGMMKTQPVCLPRGCL